MSNLYALVLTNGEVKFIRKGQKHGAMLSQPLMIILALESGEQVHKALDADPMESIAFLCRELMQEYQIVSVGDMPLQHPELLEFCFYDLANKDLTLELKVERMPERMPKRRRLIEAPPAVTRDENLEHVWEKVWEAYQHELVQDIKVSADSPCNSEVPFRVGDVMAPPFDMFVRQRQAAEYNQLDVITTSSWTLLALPNALRSLSSDPGSWGTLAIREGTAPNTVVSLRCAGHDSNPAQFALEMVSGAMPAPWKSRPDIFL